MLVASIAISTALALTGCATGDSTDSGATAPGGTNATDNGTDSSSAFHDLNGQWELFSATDAAGAFDLSSLTLLGGSADVSISLTLTDGKLSGNATCNTYGGALSGLPGALSVDGLSQTEKACMDASLMELDSRYLAALGAVTSAKLGSSAGLILLGDGISLSFLPVME
jgi:heat shock protein HslJ